MSEQAPAYRENQIYRELTGIVGLNSFIGNNSSARLQMFASHLTQMPVISGAEVRRIQTGMEREYGKYTFNKKVEESIEVIEVVNRYQRSIGKDDIRVNPQTIVIYENVATREIGILDLPTFCTNHQYFGFDYKTRPAAEKLSKNTFIGGKSAQNPDGTVLLDSPSIDDNGNYMFGVNANVAMCTMPGVAEDGVVISRDFLPKLGITVYHTRVVEFGGKRFPRNLYGDENNYKPFPDIGEKIRPDGLLAALCSYDDLTAVIEQNRRDSMNPDFFFDKLVYADGADGEVVDIRVMRDPFSNQPRVPEGMDDSLMKYENARRRFYGKLLSTYNQLRRQRGEALEISREYHRLLVEAIAVLDDNEKQKVDKLYRANPLDDWRIEFVIKYKRIPSRGFKLTGVSGDKGVICHIAEPHEMPVDEQGNRADMVFDPNSTISRMNVGRVYEQYINASARDTAKNIRHRLGYREGQRIVFEQLYDHDPALIAAVWDYLKGFYRIVSPVRMGRWADSLDERRIYQHLMHVVNDGIYIYLPAENEAENIQIVEQLEQNYRPVYGPITYIGNSGIKRTTKRPVRIGPMYVLLLEKTGDDWTAVSSGKFQSYGVLSPVTNADKYSQPTTPQSTRVLGESEVRILETNTEAGTSAEMLDRNNNPQVHEMIVENILLAPQPTNIDHVVDRTKIPYGGSKPLQLVKHLAQCAGWEFAYRPHDPTKNIFNK